MTKRDSPSRSRTPRRPARTLASTLAAGVVSALLLTSCFDRSGLTTVAAPDAPTSSTTPAAGAGLDAGGVRVLLRMPDGTATISLADTPAAQQFAAALPIDIVLRDPVGQAKSGRLPDALDVGGADRVLDPELAGLYYWPPSGDIGIVYDDLGQTVPPPGLVQLGAVTDGLATVADAGNRFTVRIERA